MKDLMEYEAKNQRFLNEDSSIMKSEVDSTPMTTRESEFNINSNGLI